MEPMMIAYLKGDKSFFSRAYRHFLSHLHISLLLGFIAAVAALRALWEEASSIRV